MGAVTAESTRARDRLLARHLVIDGTDHALEIRPEDADAVYLPLARRIAMLVENVAGQRLMIGIAGPPGAGKTVTAAILAAALEEIGARPAIIPLDGFHYPNAYLRAHDGPDHAGTLRPLASLKGWHVTFDAPRALDMLRRVRAGEDVRLPVYSRALHDPVEGALALGREHRIALVEGNYLFLDVDPWSEIRALFDVRIFVTAQADVLVAQIAERHLRGGKTREAALRWIERVDRPNMDAVLPTERFAHAVISGCRGSLVMRDPCQTGS